VAHILIAEDSRQLRELLRCFLQSAGHTVVEAADGLEAVRLANQGPLDLLICDMFMPEMDGLEVIQELGQSCPGVPVLAVSGGAYGGKLDVLAVAEVLGAVVLPKPFGCADLLSRVDELLGAKAASEVV
jgi:CheY-like chemotaxis protein